jgi:hypothetical protein
MAAKATRATQVAVDREITRLQREGRSVGWDKGAVRGTALVQQAIGGEGRRIRAMIILWSVGQGIRVPAVEVAEARQVLRLPPPTGQRGPMPAGLAAVLPVSTQADAQSPAERIAVALERVASAFEQLVEELPRLAQAQGGHEQRRAETTDRSVHHGSACGFRRSWPGLPIEAGHPFQLKPAGRSD